MQTCCYHQGCETMEIYAMQVVLFIYCLIRNISANSLILWESIIYQHAVNVNKVSLLFSVFIDNYYSSTKESTRQVCSCVISSLYTYQPSSTSLSSADLFPSMTCKRYMKIVFEHYWFYFEIVVNTMFKPGEEQDAQEFLTFLFDVLLENVP